MSLHTLLFVTNFLYLGRPSPRLKTLMAPLLAALRPGEGAAAVGLHVRIGDAALPNAVKKHTRYPPECVHCPSSMLHISGSSLMPNPGVSWAC